MLDQLINSESTSLAHTLNHPPLQSGKQHLSKSEISGAHFEEGFTCKALGAEQHERFGGGKDELEEGGKEGESGGQAEAEVNSIGWFALSQDALNSTVENIFWL